MADLPGTASEAAALDAIAQGKPLPLSPMQKLVIHQAAELLLRMNGFAGARTATEAEAFAARLEADLSAAAERAGAGVLR